MEQFTMTADEIYALKKEMKHKDKIIDDLIESMGKMADKYKIQLYEKDVKIEELNDELRITRSENVFLNGLVEHSKVETDDHDLRNEIEKLKRRIENGYDSDDDINFCDSCQSPATRECDGWDLCDKCYLRHKYNE
jgi:hypothetical protein